MPRHFETCQGSLEGLYLPQLAWDVLHHEVCVCRSTPGTHSKGKASQPSSSSERGLTGSTGFRGSGGRVRKSSGRNLPV